MSVLCSVALPDIALAVAAWAVESDGAVGEKLLQVPGVGSFDTALELAAAPAEPFADYVFDSFYLHSTEQPRSPSVAACARPTDGEPFPVTSPCHFLCASFRCSFSAPRAFY